MLKEAYLELGKAMNLKVGQKIRIIKSFTRGEFGIGTEFSDVVGDIYPNLIGKEFTIDGVCISTKAYARIVIDDNYKWIPWHCLEVISKPIEVKLNDKYTAEVSCDGITVGCQSFTFEAFARLDEAIRKVRST